MIELKTISFFADRYSEHPVMARTNEWSVCFFKSDHHSRKISLQVSLWLVDVTYTQYMIYVCLSRTTAIMTVHNIKGKWTADYLLILKFSASIHLYWMLSLLHNHVSSLLSGTLVIVRSVFTAFTPQDKPWCSKHFKLISLFFHCASSSCEFVNVRLCMQSLHDRH